MQIPSRKEAESFLAEAQTLNPGPWFSHSLFVTEAAKITADHHPQLDPEIAFILGFILCG
jgi:5-methylthioribose kinase